MIAYWLWTIQKLSSYFDEFEQVEKLLVILLTSSKSKRSIEFWSTYKYQQPKVFRLKSVCQTKIPEELGDLRHAMPRHWPLFLVSPYYLQDTMSCQWSSGDLSRVLRIWESFLLSGVFYPTLFPAGFKASFGPAVQPQS